MFCNFGWFFFKIPSVAYDDVTTIIVLVTTDNTIITITLSVRFLFMTLSYDSCYIYYQLVLANLLAKGEKRYIASASEIPGTGKISFMS